MTSAGVPTRRNKSAVLNDPRSSPWEVKEVKEQPELHGIEMADANELGLSLILEPEDCKPGSQEGLDCGFSPLHFTASFYHG